MVLLQDVKSPAEREWYARQAIDNGWSRSVLTHQIESRLFARQGRALTNFTRTLPAAQSHLAQQLIKDPYSFEFLCLGADILERDLPRGMLVCPPWTTCCDIRTISPPSASFSARADSLRDVAAAHDISAERPAPLTLLLRELKQQRKAPPSTDQFLDAWHVEETADAPEFATDTVRAAQQILLELTSSYPYGKA